MSEKGSLKERVKDHNLFPELRNQLKGAPESTPSSSLPSD